MLRIGKMADYALLLTNQLIASEGMLCTMENLVEATHLPIATVRKLLKNLVDAGIVVSHRGAKGGYHLAKEPQTFTLADVISAIEGPVSLTQCVSQPNACDLSATCGMKSNWSYVNQIVDNVFQRITLADMSRSISDRVVELKKEMIL